MCEGHCKAASPHLWSLWRLLLASKCHSSNAGDACLRSCPWTKCRNLQPVHHMSRVLWIALLYWALYVSIFALLSVQTGLLLPLLAGAQRKGWLAVCHAVIYMLPKWYCQNEVRDMHEIVVLKLCQESFQTSDSEIKNQIVYMSWEYTCRQTDKRYLSNWWDFWMHPWHRNNHHHQLPACAIDPYTLQTLAWSLAIFWTSKGSHWLSDKNVYFGCCQKYQTMSQNWLGHVWSYIMLYQSHYLRYWYCTYVQ